MAKKAKKNRYLYIILVSLIVFGIIFFLVKKESFISKDSTPQTIDLPQKFSDGWHDYSFKYPQGGTVKASIGGLNFAGRETEVPNKAIYLRVQKGSEPSTKDRVCGVEVTALNEIGGDYERASSTDPIIEINGNTWRTKKYITNPGSAFYEYKGVIWQTERGNFRYIVGAAQDNQKFCESILSTFTFKTDDSVVAAREAANVKKAAMSYIAAKYPQKVFYEGNFIYKITQGKDVLDYGDAAKVVFADPLDRKYENSVFLNLARQNDTWTVISEGQ